jgi:N6-adenosine-specific RNA methylase IME4
MSMDALRALPVEDVSAKDSCIFMWATNPFLGRAIELMEAWGFRYTTVYKTWLKRTVSGKVALTPGFWSMGSTELLLLGVRGRMQKHKRVFNARQELEAERGAHSEKPHGVRDEIAALLDVEARIELFARHESPGWDAWGLDVPSYFREGLTGSAKVVVFLRVEEQTDSEPGARAKATATTASRRRVELLYRVVEHTHRGTQTSSLSSSSSSSRARSHHHATASTASGSSTAQLAAAALERVPVVREGRPVQGIARPSRKHFARWWHGDSGDGRPRSRVYRVDPAYLEQAGDIRAVVSSSVSPSAATAAVA